MAKSHKSARFYCEECGAEVRAGAASCPSCGSRFTAVRCPECGYEGRAPEFRSGCPVCGYGLAGGQPSSPARGAAVKKRGLPVLVSRLAIGVLAALVLALLVVLVLRG